ncbi:terpene synthase family protein [Chitinophaga sp.]|uniref:terpene synthase family protein n=1 Tax=Chitinophaga sp. TaxID=1869181 RepID=UPI002F94EF41
MTPEEFNPRDYLPLNYYPWPNRVNPHLEQMGKDMESWIDNDYNFLTPKQIAKYKKMRLHACTAWMWPDLTYEQTIPCNRFMLQYVVLDDQLEDLSLEEKQLQRIRCMEILNGAPPLPEENAIYQHLALIRDEFRAFMPEIWMKRFIRYFYLTFRYGIEVEHSYKAANQPPPSFVVYKAIREYAVLMYPYLVLGEIESGLVLPDHIVDHCVFQRMMTLMVRIIIWQNDIHSLPKELAKGTEVFNVVFVLQRQYGLSLEDACKETLRIHNADLDELLTLHKEYREFGEYQEHVDKFVYYFGLAVQGVNTFYVQETERYLPGGKGFAWPEKSPSAKA